MAIGLMSVLNFLPNVAYCPLRERRMLEPHGFWGRARVTDGEVDFFCVSRGHLGACEGEGSEIASEKEVSH